MAEVPIPPQVCKRDGRGRPRLDGLRAWYTLPVLAMMCGVTVRQLELTLGAGIITQDDGRGTLRRVYICRLKAAHPDLWNSLLDLEAARAARLRAGEQPRRRSSDFEPFDPPSSVGRRTEDPMAMAAATPSGPASSP